jgi:hypothetical protein
MTSLIISRLTYRRDIDSKEGLAIMSVVHSRCRYRQLFSLPSLYTTIDSSNFWPVLSEEDEAWQLMAYRTGWLSVASERIWLGIRFKRSQILNSRTHWSHKRATLPSLWHRSGIPRRLDNPCRWARLPNRLARQILSNALQKTR